MEITREELLEFGKMATFHLDDRLVPYDRETLRAESWVSGYEFAYRHKREADDLPKEAPCDFREPNCGDMVLIHNNLNKSLPPVLAYWYECKDGNCCFINLNKEDIMYTSKNISIEYVSPEEIANIVKLYLQHQADEEKSLIDARYAYVITENKGDFLLGDYFEGLPGNRLRHTRTDKVITVTKDDMQHFAKTGIYSPGLGLEMNNAIMEKVKETAKTIPDSLIPNPVFRAGETICRSDNHDVKATITKVDSKYHLYILDNGFNLPFERQILFEKAEE